MNLNQMPIADLITLYWQEFTWDIRLDELFGKIPEKYTRKFIIQQFTTFCEEYKEKIDMTDKKAKEKAYNAAYWQEHKEELSAKRSGYYSRNKEKMREYHRQYRAKKAAEKAE
jgi:hypothetical protein